MEMTTSNTTTMMTTSPSAIMDTATTRVADMGSSSSSNLAVTATNVTALCTSRVITVCHNDPTDSGYAYHVHSQTHAVIYVVVILVLYFSALSVLIVRYMTKERKQLRSNRGSTMKKNRSETIERCCYVATCPSREIDMSSALSTQLPPPAAVSDKEHRPPSPPQLQLIVPVPSPAFLTPFSIHRMDTAV